jgi:hypothetical protein
MISPHDFADKTFPEAVDALRAKPKTAETNGAPTESISQERDGSPEYTRWCTSQAEFEARLSVVEAFIATLQRKPLPVNGAPRTPNGAPHRKRGFVITQDLSERIDAYAAHYRLRVMDLLDTALREFFAARGWSGDEGE